MHTGVCPPGREAIPPLAPKAIEEPQKTEPEKSSPPMREAPIVVSINTPIYGKAGLERLLATLRNERPDN
jgi:hypothetical protein